MTADTVGGVWTYALELARAFYGYGLEVALATMGAPLSREQRQEIKPFRNLEVYESTFKLEWMDNPWQDVAEAGAWLLQLADQIQPDVVHLNGFAHGALRWELPVLVVGHSCVLSWWRAVKGERAPASWEPYELAVRGGLENADLVVAPTQWMLDTLTRCYGPFHASRVIPNGRELSIFEPGPKENFVLCAGRLWDEAKNISMMAFIAPKLSWPVYVAGDCGHPNGSSTTFDNVNCLGKLAPHYLAGLYRRASIYALPARYEPFGLSILEAALSGCALLLGDIPSLRENWSDAAEFVSPDDPQTICERVELLISDTHWREELGQRARARALEFDIRHTARSYLAAYAELIAHHDEKKEGMLLCG
jgi:glycogen synthase